MKLLLLEYVPGYEKRVTQREAEEAWSEAVEMDRLRRADLSLSTEIDSAAWDMKHRSAVVENYLGSLSGDRTLRERSQEGIRVALEARLPDA